MTNGNKTEISNLILDRYLERANLTNDKNEQLFDRFLL